MLLLNDTTSMFASFAHDFEYFGIEHPGIVEMTDQKPRRIAQCIALACREGAAPALGEFGGRVAVTFGHYRKIVERCLLREQRYLDAAKSLMTTADRYGWTKELIDMGQLIERRLELDPSWFFANERALGDEFRAALADGVQNPAPKPKQKSAKDQGILLG